MDPAPHQPLAALPPEEFERLFQEHHARVLQAAYRITGNATDAEDVLQTIFLRLLRREDAPDLSSTPGSYFYRAAINAALDLVRRRGGPRPISLEELSTPPAETCRPSPESRLGGRELHALVRRALTRLSRSAAEIFALRYFEGYSNVEISRMLGVSQSSVGVSLHRTRAHLQRELGPWLGETS